MRRKCPEKGKPTAWQHLANLMASLAHTAVLRLQTPRVGESIKKLESQTSWDREIISTFSFRGYLQQMWLSKGEVDSR